jgi:hypothetical protein
VVSCRRMQATDRRSRALATADRRREVERGRAAFEMGTKLHNLALEYWSADRPQDAMRVGLQAVKLLGQDCPRSALIAEVLSTLGEIARELREPLDQAPPEVREDSAPDDTPAPPLPVRAG